MINFIYVQISLLSDEYIDDSANIKFFIHILNIFVFIHLVMYFIRKNNFIGIQ